ncbi:MAG TPA: pyridoxal kinase PdxY [Magnetospirillaceae bacterium]|jgi:pyridoxine kinase
MATILSIQSWVAYGHVGNAAAVFPLQRLGHEVWPIHTVQFSNHPGYGGFRGTVFDPAQIIALVAGLDERGVLARCDAVLSGYLGEAGTGDAILDAVARVRAGNPKAIFCCDPVMGDDKSGLFVRPGIPEFFQTRAMAVADVVTPNRFELELLTGTKVASLAETIAAARQLIDRGPKLVMVTGLMSPILAEGQIGTLAVTRDHAWLATSPELQFSITPNGTGDLLAALLLGHILNGRAPNDALSGAVSALFAILEQAAARNLREMPLEVEQNRLIHPPQVVPALPIG